MLEIRNLSVKIKDNAILDNISLVVPDKKIIAIMGPNGSGKTTLCHAIMGNPAYEVEGDIIFDGESIKGMKPDERSRKGIFLSFQNPPEIEGLTIYQYLKNIINSHRKVDYKQLKDEIEESLKLMGLNKDFLKRHLNYKFSGGEKKRFEMVQMLLLKPKFVMLDETDSGLDVDAVKLVSKSIKKLKDASFLIITHHSRILQYTGFDKLYVLEKGSITKEGGKKLLQEIEKNGFSMA